MINTGRKSNQWSFLTPLWDEFESTLEGEFTTLTTPYGDPNWSPRVDSEENPRNKQAANDFLVWKTRVAEVFSPLAFRMSGVSEEDLFSYYSMGYPAHIVAALIL